MNNVHVMLALAIPTYDLIRACHVHKILKFPSRRIIFLFILNTIKISFKKMVQRVHKISLSEIVLESIRPFIHLPRIESNSIACLSFLFIPNIFSPSEVDHSVAPILAIPSAFGFVQGSLGRERGDRTWLPEDVAFVYGSLRP